LFIEENRKMLKSFVMEEEGVEEPDKPDEEMKEQSG